LVRLQPDGTSAPAIFDAPQADAKPPGAAAAGEGGRSLSITSTRAAGNPGTARPNRRARRQDRAPRRRGRPLPSSTAVEGSWTTPPPCGLSVRRARQPGQSL
jgi:hypothetical protein